MVAKVEDCFLGKENGFGGHKLLGPGPWGRWGAGSHGGSCQGASLQGCVRDGDALHGSSFYGASRSGDLPTWTSHHPHTSVVGGFSKGLHNVHGSVQPQGSSVRLNAIAVPESVTTTTQNDGILTSFVSSYLMAQSQAATAAAAQPGRANTLAPGSLARNPSFESITSGSCSTPSFCVGSPVTVFPARPSDSGSKDSANSDHLLGGGPVGAAYSESRVTQPQPQLSDHYLSTDSLSYGSMEDRDAIVNCVDDFWSNPHMVAEEPLLPEFRFEPMLDDTAMSFSVGELDSLVSTNHGPTHRSMQVVQPQRGSLASMIQPAATAPDFCQSFFAGADEGEKAPIASSSTTHGSKPAQLAIPAKASLLAGFNANSGSDHNGGRLRWSDQPWSGGPSGASQFVGEKSPTSLAGSSPSSPTTPLDPHLFATQTSSSALRADEIQKKLTEFSNTGSTNSNKRSFATMAGEKDATTVQTLRGGAAPNADKFDAAALSALLYNSTQSNPEFRSAYNTTSSAPPAPKQRRRHGTATDPQSIAARTRREKFTDRIRVLQSLVPNGERLDTVHMLSQTFEYVRFLQHKVWDLYNGKDSLAEVKCEKWKEFVDTATGQVIV